MPVERVCMSREILASVYKSFYQSENFTASPIVFHSAWLGKSRWTKGSQRDIIMVADWYREEITAVSQSLDFLQGQSLLPSCPSGFHGDCF